MGKYAFKASKGAANVFGVCYIAAPAASMRRSKLLRWNIGSDAVPITETQIVHVCQRSTSAPTGTALTPNSLDPADSIASTLVVTNLVTVDGTLTAGAFDEAIALNQRGTFGWQCTPGSEILTPAVANNGIMLGFETASTATFPRYGVTYEEQ